jgi:hypothetical protein
MEEIKKVSQKLQIVRDQILARQTRWKDLKRILKDDLQTIGYESGLEFEVQVTDHIENWESVSLKLKDQDFSYFVKGNKKQLISKTGGYLVFGLMPSGFIRIGMVYPKIPDIKEKEVSFLEFELLKDMNKLDLDNVRLYFIRFIEEVIAWELGETQELKERIGFKINK